jgi:hypothetical protein
VLAFWWSYRENTESDIDNASAYCQKNKLTLVFAAYFKTELLDKKDATFTFAAIEVP